MKKIKFPGKVLQPLTAFLKKEEKKLEEHKKELAKQDPFINVDRVNDNAASDTDAAEESGHERIHALKREIDKTLVFIRKTLTKIKIGKYGLCEHCGQLIDTDRLAVNPTAQLCIDCERKKERLSTSR
ncbi:TraR/DksA family transcriptional regulator [Patescibacteria group bacterium]|nr:TraR/DksA family transcriptional regulator [Patescibacteria group bacterium]MBU1931693.1 TraR/DksA family transcriptional regulator [Patescibacteria group bacterium]